MTDGTHDSHFRLPNLHKSLSILVAESNSHLADSNGAFEGAIRYYTNQCQSPSVMVLYAKHIAIRLFLL